VRTLPVARIDPSVAVGFLCETRADWIELKVELARISGGDGSSGGGARASSNGSATASASAPASLFHVSETRPEKYEAADDVDDEWALI
jgi:hypothetical protein